MKSTHKAVVATKIEFENPGPDPTDKDLANAEVMVQALAQIYGQTPVLLSPAERARLVKAGAADETFIPKIVELARRRGFVIPNVDFDVTVKSLGRAQRLDPLRAHAEMFAQVSGDAVRSARGLAWANAMIIYSVLVHASRADVALARELVPIKAFFVGRHIKRVNPNEGKRKGKGKAADAKGKGKEGSVDGVDASKPKDKAPVDVQAGNQAG